MKIILSKQLIWILLLFPLLLNIAYSNESNAQPDSQQIVWAIQDEQGNTEIQFYFFWSESCPHCTKARPYINRMPEFIPWLKVHSLPVSNPDNKHLYKKMASSLGQDASSVPGFIFCGVMLTGFDEQFTPHQFENMLLSCHQQYQENIAEPQTGSKSSFDAPVIEIDNSINIPFIGVVDTASLSLPVLTLVLAGLDSFNPCAFFVLLFLLSLLVHARNRKRMLFIGSLYISISGIVYFLFMAAWLNLFMLIGDARWITIGAGLVAIFIALINIKDFFWFKQGVSLSIPDSVKPSLFQRMRGLLNAKNGYAMVFGTVVLAVVANSYELLCTAGFPMVYTRALTFQQLPTSTYYSYLVLYNLIYVIPLMLIVFIFVITLGARKLQEQEGKRLKLMSGFMMLGLGGVLVIAPGLLNNVMIAIGLLVCAILMTYVVSRFYRHSNKTK